MRHVTNFVTMEYQHKKCHQCSICQKSFKENSKLRAHIRKVHSTQIFCDLCNYTVSAHYQERLNDHRKRVHQGIQTKFQCTYCDLSFVNLDKHTQSVHDINEKIHKCDFCNKAFPLQGRT